MKMNCEIMRLCSHSDEVEILSRKKCYSTMGSSGKEKSLNLLVTSHKCHTFSKKMWSLRDNNFEKEKNGQLSHSLDQHFEYH